MPKVEEEPQTNDDHEVIRKSDLIFRGPYVGKETKNVQRKLCKRG